MSVVRLCILAKLTLAEFLRSAEYHKIWLCMHPRNAYFDKIVRTSTISWLFLFFFLSSQLTSYWFSIDGRLRPIFSFRRSSVCFLLMANFELLRKDLS